MIAMESGHMYLCKKGLAFLEISHGRRWMVRTLPRSDKDILETAKMFFNTDATTDSMLTPGSCVICAHVAGTGTRNASNYRVALPIILHDPSLPTGKELATILFNKLALCTIAILDGLCPPRNLREEQPVPGRTMSMSLVTASDWVEHVEVHYEDSKHGRDGTHESVRIRGHVYDASLELRAGVKLQCLTPEFVHQFVYGDRSVGVKDIVDSDLPPRPLGSAPGGVAVLFSWNLDKWRLYDAVRLLEYNHPLQQWTVQPVTWDARTNKWTEARRADKYKVRAEDVCIDRVEVPLSPPLWKTMWKPDSTADNVALMCFATLDACSRMKGGGNIWIYESGRSPRKFKLLPNAGFVVLPSPMPRIDVDELKRELLGSGFAHVVDRSSELEGGTGVLEVLAGTIEFVRSIYMTGKDTVTLVKRTKANYHSFHLMQGVLTCQEALL